MRADERCARLCAAPAGPCVGAVGMGMPRLRAKARLYSACKGGERVSE